MTENERLTINGKEVILYREVETNLYRFSKEAVDMLLEALEEREQYRAIGTVEGYKDAIQSSIENYNLYREYKAKVQEFEAIGTVEEFRALKDKSVAKKPKSNKVIFSGDSYAYCPHCKGSIEEGFMNPRICGKCGGELDWS